MKPFEINREPTLRAKPRLFICDVDRTLLTHNHQLLPNVVEAARELRKAGIPLLLASARSPTGLERVHSQVCASDPVICFNGAWVGSFSSRETWSESRIESSLSLEAIGFVHSQAGCPVWFHLDNCIACQKDEAIARLRTNVTGDSLVLVDRPAELLGMPYKILAIIDPGRVDHLVTSLSARFQGQLEISQSGPNLVEIVTPKARKDLAARTIIERLNISSDGVVVAGDSDNDLQLLKWAACSITLENAKEHIKAVADIVVDSCDNGGIASAFKWLSRRNYA